MNEVQINKIKKRADEYATSCFPYEKQFLEREAVVKCCVHVVTETIAELEKRIADLETQIEKMKWHKLDWDKAEENPNVDKLVRVRTRSGAEYICETYSYFPTEDEIGYGSVITQFAELNGDWVDDNEIEYWCYIEPFKEIKEK